MKTNVSVAQLIEAGIPESMDKIVSLGKLVKEDYKSMLRGAMFIDRQSHSKSMDYMLNHISKDFNITSMLNILERYNYHFDKDWCNILKNGSFCDCLWTAIIEVLEW